jgi:F-box-like
MVRASSKENLRIYTHPTSSMTLRCHNPSVAVVRPFLYHYSRTLNFNLEQLGLPRKWAYRTSTGNMWGGGLPWPRLQQAVTVSKSFTWCVSPLVIVFSYRRPKYTTLPLDFLDHTMFQTHRDLAITRLATPIRPPIASFDKTPPIMRLPFELMLSIFRNCDPDIKSRLTLTHTSRPWMAIASHTASLWTLVQMVINYPAEDERFDRLLLLLEMQLDRAAGMPLDVVWTSNTRATFDSRLIGLFRRKGPFSQWRTLELGLLAFPLLFLDNFGIGARSPRRPSAGCAHCGAANGDVIRGLFR